MAGSNAAASEGQNDAQVEHIGPKPHPARNLFIVLGLAAFVATMWLVYWRAAGPEHPSFGELDHFREAMWNKCKDAHFSGPTSTELARRYARESQLRVTVIDQYHALQRGQVGCEQVMAAIKSVGYPLE